MAGILDWTKNATRPEVRDKPVTNSRGLWRLICAPINFYDGQNNFGIVVRAQGFEPWTY